MPTLTRLIVTCAVIAGLAYGAMVALVVTVEPEPREIRVPVPLDDRIDTSAS